MICSKRQGEDTIKSLAQHQQSKNAVECFANPVQPEIQKLTMDSSLPQRPYHCGIHNIGEKQRKLAIQLSPQKDERKHQQDRGRCEAQEQIANCHRWVASLTQLPTDNKFP